MSFRSLYTCGLLLNAKLIISHHKAPYGHDIIYCCPVKLSVKLEIRLILLTKYQPFWLSLGF